MPRLSKLKIVRIHSGATWSPNDSCVTPDKLPPPHEENDKQSKDGGIFCEKDRRYLSGAYYRPGDEDGGVSFGFGLGQVF